MEHLTDYFANSTSFTNKINDIDKLHPRFDLYKKGKHTFDQDERRKIFLEKQKNLHFDYLSHVRSLASINCKRKICYTDNSTNNFWNKNLDKRYANQLMIAEWLVEKPSDFETNWFMIPCPVGKRCIVISANNKTRSYDKNGIILGRAFNSILPGGSSVCPSQSLYHDIDMPCDFPDSSQDSSLHNFPKYFGKKKVDMAKKNECCVLDCICDTKARIYYVLDVMAWGGQVFYGCEADFRCFWLNAKFDELSQDPDIYKYKFVRLESFGPPLIPAFISRELSNHQKYIFTRPDLVTNNQNQNLFPNTNKDCCKDVMEERIQNGNSVETKEPIPRNSLMEYDIDKNKPINLDGLLFFHKESYYAIPLPLKDDEKLSDDKVAENMAIDDMELGNPLVGWVKCDQVEILNIIIEFNE
ncbi:unnamed protein product [Gordionus sp. m RMFG-2023]